MTQEEKAKAYDEALETAKTVLETDLHESGVWAIKKIFPELKESEDELEVLDESHWKPSEEQMQALSETIAFVPDTFKPKCTLVTLQDDLKKLME